MYNENELILLLIIFINHHNYFISFPWINFKLDASKSALVHVFLM